jgi:NAD(P)-dependent dehydrogenase (short-subunit alcohol dehydrogenase family)
MPEKIAWVTGASGYWGRKFTLSLLRQGWTVVALCRREPVELLSWAKAKGQLLSWHPFDFEDENCLETLELLPTPQALFHCSAMYDESLERMLKVNVSQPIHLINLVVNRMEQQGGGSVGVLLGQNGRLGLLGLGCFSATQGALWTWVESTARSLKARKSNTSVTLVFPPRAPSHLQRCLAKDMFRQVQLKPTGNADGLVSRVMAGKSFCGRRPVVAGLLTILGL